MSASVKRYVTTVTQLRYFVFHSDTSLQFAVSERYPMFQVKTNTKILKPNKYICRKKELTIASINLNYFYFRIRNVWTIFIQSPNGLAF